jgi:ribonuclease D
MDPRPVAPDKESIALLETFERLALDRIELVADAAHAERAAAELLHARVWGFDTESKPTFLQGEASDGPHVVQLALPDKAFVFQLHDEACRAVVARLLGHAGIVKAGFGLGDDKKRIARKLGVQPQDVLDLNGVLRQRGWRREMGVKAAVAVLFQRRYLKSKKATTSNWANRQLTPAQLLYAANDAWAALRVYQALGLP